MLLEDPEKESVVTEETILSFDTVLASLQNESDVDTLALKIFEALNGEGSSLNDQEKFREFSDAFRLEVENASKASRTTALTKYANLIIAKSESNPTYASQVAKQVNIRAGGGTPSGSGLQAEARPARRISLVDLSFAIPAVLIAPFVTAQSVNARQLGNDVDDVDIESRKSEEPTKEIQLIRSVVPRQIKSNLDINNLNLIETQEVSDKRRRKQYLQGFIDSLTEFARGKKEEAEKDPKREQADTFFEPAGRIERMARILREAALNIDHGLNESVILALSKLVERLQQKYFIAEKWYKGLPTKLEVSDQAKREFAALGLSSSH